jgi:hypothetical protein
VSLNDTEHALGRDHLRSIGTGDGTALLRRQLISALRRLWSAGPESSRHVRHAPDSVLVCNEQVIALPSKTVWLVEILDVTLNPFRPPGAVVTQQRQVTSALLRHQNVAVWQHQQPTRICKAGRKRGLRRSLQAHLAPGLRRGRRVTDW